MKKSLGAQTLAYPAPVWVVGTYDKQGKPNVMTIAWGGICCSVPPCVAISLRRATYTYAALMERKAFTLNVPSEEHVKEADYFGIATGRSADKLSAAKLTPVRSEVVDAPYLQEFPVVLECKVIHTVEIGLHTQFIGQIVDVKADPSVLGANGFPDVEKIRPIVFSPHTHTYHGVGKCLGEAFVIGKQIGGEPGR
jgi:flavin reductase (DIM6/NTAB) family NADH-FMN oxidoreductase RutF